MVSPYYSILLIFLIFISLQYTLKLKLIFNAKKNIGKIQLKFLNIKIIDNTFCFGKGYIKITNRVGKSKYLPIEFNTQTFQDYADFETIIFKKIYFKAFGIYFNFGVKNDAFLSSMLCGYLDIFAKILYCVLKTKKSEVELKLKIYPNYNFNVIKLGIKAKISLSIFDLLWR